MRKQTRPKLGLSVSRVGIRITLLMDRLDSNHINNKHLLSERQMPARTLLEEHWQTGGYGSIGSHKHRKPLQDKSMLSQRTLGTEKQMLAKSTTCATTTSIIPNPSQTLKQTRKTRFGLDSQFNGYFAHPCKISNTTFLTNDTSSFVFLLGYISNCSKFTH